MVCTLWLLLTDLRGQYIDTLARDLGVKVNRKSNPFSEMFLPYRPSDYRGLVGEFLQAEAARNRAKVEKAS